MKRLVALAGLALSIAIAAPASATTLVEGTGWQADQLTSANTPSTSSPWTFTLTSEGLFSVVDGFVAGDLYNVLNSSDSGLLGTTTFYAGSGPETTVNNLDGFSTDWTDASFSKLVLLLQPGTYSLNIEGNGTTGFPSGFGVRLDAIPSVPEPATWAMMILGVAMAGFAARRRNAVALIAA
jgi:hypothetical protein